MGHRGRRPTTKSHTLPSSPTHSSDFEFNICVSPRKSSGEELCPADELFYKGQLLPLHLSPRLSMVRTLLLSSSSTSSSSDTTTTGSRDSTDLLHCDSARPSSATDDDIKHNHSPIMTSKYYFSLPKLSSVFRKDQKSGAVKRAREVIRKYLKKVKPFYEKLSQKPPPQHKTCPPTTSYSRIEKSNCEGEIEAYSFSGNLRLYNRGRSCFSSCPSSPSHARNGYGYGHRHVRSAMPGSGSNSSSMEELQSAVQGAIMHCKNSMLQSKILVTNEI